MTENNHLQPILAGGFSAFPRSRPPVPHAPRFQPLDPVRLTTYCLSEATGYTLRDGMWEADSPRLLRCVPLLLPAPRPRKKAYAKTFFCLAAVRCVSAARRKGTGNTDTCRTLLHCTIDDPTISPKTAQVGDPVLCHLSQFTGVRSRGLPARLPTWRTSGSGQAGPGTLLARGYLDIVFDHIGLPNTDADLNARIVGKRQGQARG